MVAVLATIGYVNSPLYIKKRLEPYLGPSKGHVSVGGFQNLQDRQKTNFGNNGLILLKNMLNW